MREEEREKEKERLKKEDKAHWREDVDKRNTLTKLQQWIIFARAVVMSVF
jgi:hypothetical protein